LGLLDTYNRKRDFKKTPEPKGVVRASEGERPWKGYDELKQVLPS